VRLLIDAQMPQRLARALAHRGHDVVHTSDLPLGNRTLDVEIIRFADTDNRVVVTKDRDFVDSHILTGRPRALLLVSTGNISNDELVALFVTNLDRIVAAYEISAMVELSSTTIVAHG